MGDVYSVCDRRGHGSELYGVVEDRTMKKAAMLFCLAGLMLTGCKAAPPLAAQVAPVTPALATSQALVAPTVLTEQQMRHVMNVSSDQATLWGLDYSQSYLYNSGICSNTCAGADGKTYRSGQYYVLKDAFSGNANFVGAGTLTKGSYYRYVYQVPEGQALVINKLDGNGTVYVNGFPASVQRGFWLGYASGGGTSYPDKGLSPINYLFGPGSLVVVTFYPNMCYESYSSSYYGQYITRSYTNLNISGFTVSPQLLSSIGVTANMVK